MTAREENLKKLKKHVATMFGDYSSIYMTEGELYFNPSNRYNQYVTIRLTEEQIVELAVVRKTTCP